jgi:hypothetical protein
MSGRKKWEPDRMKAAITAISKKEMGSLKASHAFRVPQTPLERYVKMNSYSANRIQIKLGRKPVLPLSI